MGYYEDNMKNLLGDDFKTEDELKKSNDYFSESIETLIKSGEVKKLNSDKKDDVSDSTPESRKKESTNTNEKSGLIPKGTSVVSTEKNKRFSMTRDHHTNFNHDVGNMLLFEWSGDTFYVAKKDVEDYEDGSIMKIETEKSKKEVTIKKSEELDGIKDTKVKNTYKYHEKLKNSLGISREDMPQINSKDLDKFIAHFEDKVKIKKMSKKVSELKFAQNEINEDKVLEMMKNPEKHLKRNFIISLDGYLLDGNHSAASLLENNESHEVKVTRISLPFKSLKKRANQMKITKNKDLDDNNSE